LILRRTARISWKRERERGCNAGGGDDRGDAPIGDGEKLTGVT
jgi:hypothetical protein